MFVADTCRRENLLGVIGDLGENLPLRYDGVKATESFAQGIHQHAFTCCDQHLVENHLT
jgi:hypothetical protein